MCLKPRLAKFQQSSTKGTFSNMGLNGGVGKMCALQWKTGQWPYLENGER